NPEVPAAIRKIVEQIHTRLPHTKVLLLGIFPHGATPDQTPWTASARAHIVAVNKEIAGLDDGSRTRFLDIGGKFLQPDGSISKEVMPDGLHPAGPGYQIWADAMQPLLLEMLGAQKES
ncbi:MAG: GDSL-type esterase/lipase family protein, partial [Candidatus Methylacidiphilales bacterium]